MVSEVLGNDVDRAVGTARGGLCKKLGSTVDGDVRALQRDAPGRRGGAGVDRVAVQIDRVGLDRDALAVGRQVFRDVAGFQLQHRRAGCGRGIPGDPVQVGLVKRSDALDHHLVAAAAARADGDVVGAGYQPRDVEDEGVVAAAALEGVRAASAGEREGAEREGGCIDDIDACPTGQERMLDSGQNIRAFAADDQAGVSQGEIVSGAASLDERIAAQTARNRVGARAADENIIAVGSDQYVVACATVDADARGHDVVTGQLRRRAGLEDSKVRSRG